MIWTYNKNKLCRISECWSRDMLRSKGRGLASPAHFVHGFSRKIFHMLIDLIILERRRINITQSEYMFLWKSLVVFKLLVGENYNSRCRNRRWKSVTFYIYNSSKGRKKEERIRKYWIIFIKFKADILSKLFCHWELQYTLVILSD